MKKIFSIFLIILLLCPAVLADGVVLTYDRDMWNLASENQQLAAINYKDGFENMLISISLNDDIHGEKAVWMFPVPVKPDDVVIDVLKGFPSWYGKDIDTIYKEAVSNSGLVMAGYSTFPVGSLVVLPFIFVREMFSASGRMESASAELNGVTVYETINKMGLTTELITAKSQSSLTQYLQNKGLDLPENSKAMLNYYVGKDYSFVISYISNLTQFKDESQMNSYSYSRRSIPLGVFVKFPTDKIYFPLKPTSVYESQQIPIEIYVMGHVTPELYTKIKPLTEVTYYKQNYLTASPNLASFFNTQQNDYSSMRNVEHTKIKITAPSKYFADDLWIKDSAPVSVGFKNFFATYRVVFGIILFIIFSMLASLLAGLVSFRKEPVPKKHLMLHGLWNCLTAIGFIIATIFMKTKEIDPRVQTKLTEMELDVTPRDKRKILYAFLFYVFFIALVVASSLLLVYAL